MFLKSATNKKYFKFIAVGLLGTIFIWAAWLKFLVYPIREVEAICHEGDSCVCLKGALKYQAWDKDLTRLIGRSHAGGLCGAQDLEQAKFWFGKYQKSSGYSVGALLFYSAVDISAMSETPLSEDKKKKIVVLILESIAMGFQPTEKDYEAFGKGNSFEADVTTKLRGN